MSADFEETLEKALLGRKIWLEKGLDKHGLVILDCGFPEMEKLCARAEAIAQENPQETIALLSPSPPELSRAEAVKAAEDEIEAVIALHSLYDFTPSLAIASLDRPSGRKLLNLLDAGEASLDELIDAMLWQDFSSKPQAPPRSES